MKDKETHKIIQQSLKAPSDQFMDNLMFNIELEKENAMPNYFNKSLFLIIIGALVTGVFIYFSNEYTFLAAYTKIRIPTIFIKLSFIGILLFGFYQLLNLYTYQSDNKTVRT